MSLLTGTTLLIRLAWPDGTQGEEEEEKDKGKEDEEGDIGRSDCRRRRSGRIKRGGFREGYLWRRREEEGEDSEKTKGKASRRKRRDIVKGGRWRAKEQLKGLMLSGKRKYHQEGITQPEV